MVNLASEMILFSQAWTAARPPRDHGKLAVRLDGGHGILAKKRMVDIGNGKNLVQTKRFPAEHFWSGSGEVYFLAAICFENFVVFRLFHQEFFLGAR